MTDHTRPDSGALEMADDPRLELITDYLAGALPPDAVADVRRRLDEDADFREYCAPLILAWSVPPLHVREPMSRAELAKHWDTFTKRAGFVHQRRRARKRWLTILGLAVFVVGVSVAALKDRARAWYHDVRDFHTLAYAEGWVPFGEGREAQLSRDTRLRVANKQIENVLGVRLEGTARFRTLPADTTSMLPELHFIGIETRAGRVAVGGGEFTVSARGDTTDVEVHHPTVRQFIGFVPIPGTAMVFTYDAGATPLPVREGQRARIIRGFKPQLLP